MYWEEVKKILAEELSLRSFERWVHSTTAVIDHDWIVVKCVDEQQRNALQTKYGSLMIDAVQTVFGSSMTVVLAIDEEYERLAKRYAPMSLREYVLALEQRMQQLEERVQRCEQLIDQLQEPNIVH
ncbi:hypothetical protein [Anoxybacteroides amylolyticum]|uniref:DnaA N-terminal domain-containing protein n=1 Tax=Anoxybacteroides amylolyticum TaxID=294699 RepID=A0A167T470_9BACL|nr:hypothetical protein [Anoxybacillus amylolyticus]ANB59424.1 hypothetical protein GFC30_2159 [Anoxybacillus amylolyticus]